MADSFYVTVSFRREGLMERLSDDSNGRVLACADFSVTLDFFRTFGFAVQVYRLLLFLLLTINIF